MTDLMNRRRALMVTKNKDLPILNPAIGYTENTKIDKQKSPPYLASQNGVVATDFIYAGTTGNFVYFNPLDRTIAPNGIIGNLLQYDSDNVNSSYTDWWNCGMTGAGEKSVALASNKKFIRLNLSMEQMSGAYAYNSATGQVYYAGINTPYYGKTNIND